VKRAPDVAFVTMTVESRAKGPRDAQRQNADAMAAVVRKMGELGIPKDGLQTIGLTLYEDVDNANGRRVSRGFVARNSVEVRIDDIARAGEIADAGCRRRRDVDRRHPVRHERAGGRGARGAAACGCGSARPRRGDGRGRWTLARSHTEDRGRHRRAAADSSSRTMAMRAEAVTTVEPGLIELEAEVTLTASMK
jgi:uncharacterized protein YggE